MEQQVLFEPEMDRARTLLSELLENSKLYKTSDDFRQLLAFVIQLGNMAPFNAMLLQIQKPGLRFAATAYDWRRKFRRTIKEGARPLLILWPFSPVALVYDCEDTEGPPLPDAVVSAFRAMGPVMATEIEQQQRALAGLGINAKLMEYGDGYAGHVRANRHGEGEDRQGETEVRRRSQMRHQRPDYEIRLNAKHTPNVQFATLAHELAHLFLGHLGKDVRLMIPERPKLAHHVEELEAEAVSYIVCRRRGVDSRADAYLANHVNDSTTLACLDLYVLTRAAGHVETALGIAPKIAFEQPKPTRGMRK